MLWLWLCLLVGRGYLHALQDCHEGKKKKENKMIPCKVILKIIGLCHHAQIISNNSQLQVIIRSSKVDYKVKGPNLESWLQRAICWCYICYIFKSTRRSNFIFLICSQTHWNKYLMNRPEIFNIWNGS